MNTKEALRELKILAKYGKRMRLAAEKWHSDWQTLISIILSARTRDETTIRICKQLFGKYGSIGKLARASLKDIEKIIRPVNFYITKSKNIINLAKIIVNNYNSQIPHDFSKLIELPGVGRKTANVFLAEKGYGTIGVDTHVGYCSKYLGWTNSEKQEEVERDLKELFPEKLWGEINWVLVRFGQTYTSMKEKNRILDNVNKIK